MAVGHYVTAEELRVELGLEEGDTAGLSDSEAARLILIAETLIEGSIGPRRRLTSGPQEGRVVAELDVAGYQWEALTGAVRGLAARFKRDPKILQGQRFQSVSGPGFSYSGPLGPVFGTEVLAMLAASGLRPTHARLSI